MSKTIAAILLAATLTSGIASSATAQPFYHHHHHWHHWHHWHRHWHRHWR